MCYSSPIFDAAFNDNFKEGKEQSLTLTDCSPETFSLVVQWMYQSLIVLPIPKANPPANSTVGNTTDGGPDTSKEAGILKAPNEACTQVQAESPQSSIAPEDLNLRWAQEEKLKLKFYPNFARYPAAQTISRLLAFLRVADKIDLIGPFDSVIATMKDVLRDSTIAGRWGVARTALMSGHVRLAAEMPLSHPVRKLIADTCFREFVQDLFSPVQPPAKMFRFDRELRELDGFAADMLRKFRQTSKRRVQGAKKEYEWVLLDPLTETEFRVSA